MMKEEKRMKQVLKANNTYSFLTDTITFKAQKQTDGKKKYYVTGYISVPEIDLYNDLITPNALKSMLLQIAQSNITLDYEHEAWRDDHTILPAGRITEAKIDDRGLWVKAELNRHSPKFKNLWGSIKDGFIKAFSIAFKPLKTVMKTIGDTEVRLIEDLQLLNVALTGAPVNQSAVMTDFGMKSVMLKAIGDMEHIEGNDFEECVLIPKSLVNNKEVDKMAEEEAKAPVEEAPKEESPKEKAPAEDAPAGEEAPKEDAPAEGVEEKGKEKKKEDEEEEEEEKKKPEEKAMEKMAEELKTMADKQKELENELKSLKETDVFKSLAPKQPEVKAQEKDVSVLGSIR